MTATVLDKDGNVEGVELRQARVLVVDDHRSFAEMLSWALQSVPGMESVGVATSAAQGVAMATELQPDIVVMDIEMPGVDGISATERIRVAAPDAVIAVLTAHCTGEWLFKAAHAGASAFIAKNGSVGEMIGMLGRAQRGHMLVAESAFDAPDIAPGKFVSAAAPAVTPREHEVLQFMGQGLKAGEIAAVLGITVYTCRGYIKALLKKLGANNQLEEVLKAQNVGLITGA
jgi:DNA-binding NarL/FixJ family response regulator